MSLRSLFALALVAAALSLVWFAQNQTIPAPAWNDRVKGMSYNPSGIYSSEALTAISEDRIRTDLEQLSQWTDRVRTYSVSNGLDRVPVVAAHLGMKVSLGIWLNGDRKRNAQEIDEAIRVIRQNPYVIDRVFVGNEAVLRGELSAEEVGAYMRQIKRVVRRVHVSTGEPWNVWLANPKLAEEADFIGAHMLPYWEGVSLKQSIDHIYTKMAELAARFPGKPIVIGEAGWPSEGRIRKGSVPTPPNQAAFFRRFVAAAESADWDYYMIEAYDQPWKMESEGAVGAYWGTLDADGRLKWSRDAEITALPNWSTLALASIIVLLVGGAVLLALNPHVSLMGQIFLAGLVGTIGASLVAIIHGAALEYASTWTYVIFIAILPVAALAIAVMVSEAIEMAHALWRTQSSRRALPRGGVYHPKVSIHVPCYNEPPAMVIETLNALARLDYPEFEVILLDNNTKDPSVWRPVEDHCAALGPRFRFFHLDNVKGFKAGALNEALARTAHDAEIVAVIDSDYVVDPDWLSQAIPYFFEESVALVQAPQDYRDGAENAFKTMCYQEYTGFFRIGMVERDEANAIIQHGTMTMMRKNVLAGLGGWAPWCITEDSELGLRVFEAGYEAVYINRSLGRGVMPDTLAAFKSQRHRWAYGAMQILKRHAGELFLGQGTKLTLAQRYHFVSGWLPWIADALAVIFVGGALLWTVLMTIAPKYFDLPMASLATIAIGLFMIKTVKTLVLYPVRVSPHLGDAVRASIAGLALSHTVGKAVLSGLFTSSSPFLRTPKMEDGARLKQVFAVASEEIVILLALIAAAIATALSWGLDEPVAVVWIVMLAVQALPYMATLVMAIVSAVPAGIPVQLAVKQADASLPAATPAKV
ncbi:MAG: glycosyltransferase [Alphaproteobacteria bacterium]|nr:glycosyltransferase [Alphaproteobacteria bacterium]